MKNKKTLIVNNENVVFCDIDDTIVAPAEKYKPIQNVIDFLIENIKIVQELISDTKFKNYID